MSMERVSGRRLGKQSKGATADKLPQEFGRSPDFNERSADPLQYHVEPRLVALRRRSMDSARIVVSARYVGSISGKGVDVSLGDIEQRTADRFRDLFNVAWARGISALVVYSTTLWVVTGVGPALRRKHPITPRPLTWWQDQLGQMEVHYPQWLCAVTSWHTSSHASAVLAGLCACALAASLASRRMNAPGYELGGLLALTLSAQWFGLMRTLTWFGGFTAGLVGLALLLAARSYVRNRLDYRPWSEREGVEYSLESIGFGVAVGPALLLLTPLLYPLSRIVAAVQFFGDDHDREVVPRERQALEKIVRDADRNGWRLTDMPAGVLLRAIMALQLTGRSRDALMWNKIALLSPQADGAVTIRSHIQDFGR